MTGSAASDLGDVAGIDVSEVADYLRLTKPDQNLRSILAAAAEAVAGRVGPLEATQLTARLPLSTAVVVPAGAPLLSVDQIQVNGAAVTTVDADLQAGVIYSLPAGTAPSCTVTYTVGWVPLPSDLRLAVCELTRHLWQSQRGANQGQGGPPAPQPGMGYALPNRVQELLRPYQAVHVA